MAAEPEAVTMRTRIEPPEEEMPNNNARVTLVKTKEGIRGELTDPVDPTFNLVQLVVFVCAAIGAVLGLVLTFEALPSEFSTLRSGCHCDRPGDHSSRVRLGVFIRNLRTEG